MAKGYIYIMTNPALTGMVKIGYAANVESRRKNLSTTALPYDYEVYATYETSGKLEDLQLHKLIDRLNPDLRVTKNREFFLMSPEEAYELLEAIAIISGSQGMLKREKEVSNPPKQKIKRSPVDFYLCGFKDGDKLVYVDDESVVVTVYGNRKVLYNEEITSLSAIAGKLKGGKSVAGPSYFTYNGKLVADIANDTQWKDFK